MKKENLLRRQIKHFDIKSFNCIPLVEQFKDMSLQARNIAEAARMYDTMLCDKECTIILCLAGSLFSAGLKKVVYDLIDNNMVDAVVSTGAIIADQDFFEALGFSHYRGTNFIDDNDLMEVGIDRIYDTFIDEDQLRVCDATITEIADSLPAGAYSSRQFIEFMGDYLEKNNPAADSVVLRARQKGVPIFVPAFSDCSAGLGLVLHQWKKQENERVAIDSVKDLLELTGIKAASKNTGLFIVGGGVPKNFAQDITIAADIVGESVDMHRYAIQVTVADERDGALSGSTLKEAHSWGKVGNEFEQMVFSEATVALPIIASSAYHAGNWKSREEKRFNNLLDNSSSKI